MTEPRSQILFTRSSIRQSGQIAGCVFFTLFFICSCFVKSWDLCYTFYIPIQSNPHWKQRGDTAYEETPVEACKSGGSDLFVSDLWHCCDGPSVHGPLPLSHTDPQQPLTGRRTSQDRPHFGHLTDRDRSPFSRGQSGIPQQLSGCLYQVH